MSDTVFWSWQADLPAKSNREFIRNCLAEAVKQVSTALDVDEMERVDLDHDTKDTLGMVDISEAVLNKIRACAVMVADVTPIATTEPGKSLPNPNVMVELGYAMASIGFGRIIAILNTANGDKEEALPFDIRNRRILTYTLSTEASKAERDAERKTLIRELTGAIKINITKVRDERSTAEEIVGVDSDPGSVGLWQAERPMECLGQFGTLLKVNPTRAFRAWLRVIPRGFSRSIPSISALGQLPNDAQLRVPRGGGVNVNYGSFEFGYMAYSASSKEDDDTIQARNLVAFLEETGEVWMSDGSAFDNRKNKEFISCDHLLSNWVQGLKNAMVCMDELGALSQRRVIVGIEGLENTFWPCQLGYTPARSRKPEMVHEETKGDWSNQDQTEFLMTAWNKLRDAFTLDPMTVENFADYYDDRA